MTRWTLDNDRPTYFENHDISNIEQLNRKVTKFALLTKPIHLTRGVKKEEEMDNCDFMTFSDKGRGNHNLEITNLQPSPKY